MIDVFATALGGYGITLLVTEYDGPFNVFDKLRRYKLFTCFACLSVWVVAGVAYMSGLEVSGYLAAVGMVLLADRVTS